MFCKNCGNQVPDNANVCPSCGTRLKEGKPAAAPKSVSFSVPAVDGKLCLTLGIVSIVLGLFGAILFGTIPAVLALVCGIIGLVQGINLTKTTDDGKAKAGFVCSIIGVVLSVIMTISCTFCGACSCGMGWRGCVGSACHARSQTKKLEKNINNAYGDLLEGLEEIGNSTDWDDLLNELQNY